MHGIRRVDGYLPIEDHGLIGDGATAALVGRDGSIPWLCVPRFDSPPLFCGLLDRGRGGAFTVAPEDVREGSQRYEGDSGVLVTDLRSPEGLVRITDALVLRSGVDLSEDTSAARGELIRSVRVLEGAMRVQVEVEPRDGAEVEPRGGGLRVRVTGRPDLDLQLTGTRPLEGLRTAHDLREGDRLELVLSWSGSHRRRAEDPAGRLEETVAAWEAWTGNFDYGGPRPELVRRSAITLKMLDHFENGAIVAAPTSSLPEWIGGERNWDYRYSWIRDAAFSVYALRRIGLIREAQGFLCWVLDAVEGAGTPQVLYDLDGKAPSPERHDEELEGYRGSRPVRWGNAAVEQEQHDVYGEILDCAYQWMAGGGEIDEHLWARLRPLVDAARRDWTRPGAGIWEVRTPGRAFTYTAALCQVALDRGIRIAERTGLPGDLRTWRTVRDRISRAILDQAWNPEMESLAATLDRDALDASLLALPLRRVIPADHPKMIATTRAVEERLSAGNGLLYRYLHQELPDGLSGEEGAFLLCSFWLADNLAHQDRLEDAVGLFDSLCGRANHLGLLPEQIHPSTGEFLGNFPQAFSHVGLISTAFKLARLTGEWEPEWWGRAFSELPPVRAAGPSADPEPPP